MLGKAIEIIVFRLYNLEHQLKLKNLKDTSSSIRKYSSDVTPQERGDKNKTKTFAEYLADMFKSKSVMNLMYYFIIVVSYITVFPINVDSIIEYYVCTNSRFQPTKFRKFTFLTYIVKNAKRIINQGNCITSNLI